MQPIFISLGSDCGVAEYLRDAGLREAAFPLDWCVSYGGARRILGETDAHEACAVDASNFNDRYGVFYMHSAFPLAMPTMVRRFARLHAALADERPVVLIRRSHPLHHHFERPNALVDEVADARALAQALAVAHPAKAARGHIRVELMLACDLCHPKIDPDEAAAGCALLRVHNLTRQASATFADRFPTKTYADAMAACLKAHGIVKVGIKDGIKDGIKVGIKVGIKDGPFTLED